MPRRRKAEKTPVLPYDIVGIGASWGGVEVLSRLVRELPSDWPLPLVIVQHQHAYSGNALQKILSRLTLLPVIDVEDKDKIEPGRVYIAPANYHLLVERDHSFSLSLEAPVNYSRPSIDVTFGCLATAYRRRCIGLLLTGANQDGAEGIKMIKAQGGYTAVQDPATAEASAMPDAAIATGAVDIVLPPDTMISHLLHVLHGGT